MFYTTPFHTFPPWGKPERGSFIKIMMDRIPSEYYYDLPAEKIAQHPLPDRDTSRLLVYRNGNISTGTFIDLDNHLPADSLLVFNNSRVIRARLIFNRDSGARIEVFCLEPADPSEYAAAFSSHGPVEWICLVGNLKRWKRGALESGLRYNAKEIMLKAEKISGEGDTHRVRFSWSPGELSFGEVIEATGHIPLPPYITRQDDEKDAESYQTIYAREKGSVAAPTAGLHFTPGVFDRLDKKRIDRAEITLHVGAGTFQPVKAGDIARHRMHAESFFVTRKTLEHISNSLGRIIAVGTTSVRTLESLYWLGVKMCESENESGKTFSVDQWEPYGKEEEDITAKESVGSLLAWMEKTGTGVLKVSTRIIIVPGYKFRMIGGMITNFHQPGSTLLLLVSAWTGNNWKKIYDYALNNNFRFLSYGDSSLLLK